MTRSAFASGGPAPAGQLATAALAGLMLLGLAACPATTRPVPTPTPGGGGDIAEPQDPTPPGPTPPAPTPDDPPAPASTDVSRALWVQAEQAASAGDPVVARRHLQRLARDAGVTPEAQRARLRLGEEALARRAYDVARRWVSELDAKSAPELAFRRLAVTALAFEGEERFREARDAWIGARDAAAGAADAGDAGGGPAETGAPDETGGAGGAGGADGLDAVGPEVLDATRGAARAQFLAGDPAGAEQTVVPAAGPEAPREALVALVEPLLTRTALERLYGAVPASDPWSAWVALRVARERWDAGELEACRDAVERARAQGDPLVRAEAEELLLRLEKLAVVNAQALGVLLPLSGPYQKLGQAALEGIQLAMLGAPGVRLVVRDTRGDADEAVRQAEDLVLNANVSAILGPIGEHESRAAAAAVARMRVPHILLSMAHDAATAHPLAFRLRLSRVELGAAIARYAMVDLGIKRVGILYPDTESGRRLMAAFWDEAVRLGGEVRAVEAYAADTKDFSAVVQRLIGARKPGGGVHDFEGLFIPDAALRVRRLVPFLKFWDLHLKTGPDVGDRPKRPAVQLLGSDGWNHPAVIDRGEFLTDNAVFVASFYHDPADPAADAFAKRYFERYRRAPRAFHAEVHDVAALAAQAVLVASSTGPPDLTLRERVVATLKATRDFQGATGRMSILPSGEMVRAARVLTVDHEALRRRLPEAQERELRARERGAPGGLR